MNIQNFFCTPDFNGGTAEEEWTTEQPLWYIQYAPLAGSKC